VFPLSVPPLRERPGDILLVATGFLEREHARTRRGPTQARWAGNVRELINALERATLLQPVGLIEPHHLALRNGAQPTRSTPSPRGPRRSWAQNEGDYLVDILRQAGGKLYGRDGAAAIAQLKPTTLRSQLVKHGLRRALSIRARRPQARQKETAEFARALCGWLNLDHASRVSGKDPRFSAPRCSIAAARGSPARAPWGG
jgi:DNA-binding NtrC family response regulator